MCGRYYLDNRVNTELSRILDAMNRREGHGAKTGGEIFPGDRAPVIANSRRGGIDVFPMEWGYTLREGKRIINARSETAEEKILFREGMRMRRCLVPASYYFEWEKGPEGRIRHGLRDMEQEVQYMAGIYRMEDRGPVFAVLTRAAAQQICRIHDRMPVILPRAYAAAWLDQEKEARAVLQRASLGIRSMAVLPE